MKCPICLNSIEGDMDSHIKECYIMTQEKRPMGLSSPSMESKTTSSKSIPKVSNSRGMSFLEQEPKWEPLPKLKSCPVFRPSELEFKDPMKYISSIAAKGRQYGVIKIVPPSDKWLQGRPFNKMISTKNFVFPTKVQSLHQLQNRSGPSSKFTEKLTAFLDKRGIELRSYPVLDGQELDLYTLYNAVMARGGLKEVIRNKYWKQIAQELKLSQECTNAAFSLKQHYYKYLFAFELSQREKSGEENVDIEASMREMEEEASGRKEKKKEKKEKKEKPVKGVLGGDSGDEDETEFGYGDGKMFTLSSFKKFARQFKRKWFGENDNPSTTEIENTYWKIVETAEHAVQVLYGSDLDVGTYGSGFPGRNNSEELKKLSGWNLNKFPKVPDSLLSYLDEDIKGVIQPMMYIGMLFSTFCWHTEDNHLYSINYLHQGSSKTWYGIPDSSASHFEEVMKRTVPELFVSHPDLLFLLVTMLSPRILVKNNVPVYHTVQEAGEFVITFPNAYHAGFSHGFNCAESSNFALADWIPFARPSITLYRKFSRSSVFSFDQLIYKIAKNPHTHEHAYYAKQELPIMKAIECASRQKIFKEGTWRSIHFKDFNDDKIQECSLCKYDCFWSAIACPCSPEKISCLQHSQEHCKCDANRRILVFRHTIDEMDNLMKELGMDLRSLPPMRYEMIPMYTKKNLTHSSPLTVGVSQKLKRRKVTSRPLNGLTRSVVRKVGRRGGVTLVQGVEYNEKTNPLDHMFVIEGILDKRIVTREDKDETQFLIKWQGFPNSQSTWESEQEILCPTLMRQTFGSNSRKRSSPQSGAAHSKRRKK